MTPDLAQQRDVAKLVEPIGIVDHNGVARPVAEFDELGEDRADSGHVAGDLGVVEQLPRFVLAGGIADPCRAAAYQHDRLVSAFLEQPQQHDANKVADVQTIRCAVIAKISDDLPAAEALVKRLEIGALMDKAAFYRGRKKYGARCRHGLVT